MTNVRCASTVIFTIPPGRKFGVIASVTPKRLSMGTTSAEPSVLVESTPAFTLTPAKNLEGCPSTAASVGLASTSLCEEFVLAMLSEYDSAGTVTAFVTTLRLAVEESKIHE
jgi:hypothetical protein